MVPAHHILTQFEREEREACIRFFTISLSEAIRKTRDYEQSGSIGEEALNDAIVELLPRWRNPVTLQKIREGGGSIIKHGIKVWANKRNDEWGEQQKLQRCIPYDENADYEEAGAKGIYTADDLQGRIEASCKTILPVPAAILAWLKQKPDVLWTVVALTLPHLTDEQRPVWILRVLERWKYARIAQELYHDQNKKYLARKHFQRGKNRFEAQVMQYVKIYYGETFRHID